MNNNYQNIEKNNGPADVVFRIFFILDFLLGFIAPNRVIYIFQEKAKLEMNVTEFSETYIEQIKQYIFISNIMFVAFILFTVGLIVSAIIRCFKKECFEREDIKYAYFKEKTKKDLTVLIVLLIIFPVFAFSTYISLKEIVNLFNSVEELTSSTTAISIFTLCIPLGAMTDYLIVFVTFLLMLICYSIRKVIAKAPAKVIDFTK